MVVPIELIDTKVERLSRLAPEDVVPATEEILPPTETATPLPPLVDGFGRRMNYMRISVTDRCNFRCTYCMPAEGVPWKPRGEILTYEELLRLVHVGTRLGIDQIRITGGEPTVRRNVVDFIRELAKIPGVRDLSMTTNGLLLPHLAQPLYEAGLRRINVSIDTLQPEKFREVTRTGNLEHVMNGVRAAIAVGMNPVKINAVIMRGVNDEDVPALAQLTVDLGVDMRYIEYMPIGVSWEECEKHLVTGREMRERIRAAGMELEPVPPDYPEEPARYWRIKGARGRIGFITTLSEPFCATCNRIRLTADGKLRPCLNCEDEVDLKSVLRGGGSDDDLIAVFREAARRKWAGHQLRQHATAANRVMSQIGG
ncbi:MAG: GTP 3',8-cyclase MoaA [Abditibacteriales bacterium]|nr:GTP 3',8-cyclase MoaA [Abditibacteriales bacterium]MDW8367087.1 GTP 3',8-cyclase MoaA [Abditibacteriales bacterium]